MTTETQPAKQTFTPSAEPRPDNFISFSEIVRMILTHRRKIAVFVGLVTAGAVVFFMLSPRKYRADGFLQLIPPVTTVDEKIDRDLFETIIISHLQTIQSAFIAKEVADSINQRQHKVSMPDLQKQMKIVRPPKSSLITLTATAGSDDLAIEIVKLWIEKYLAGMRKNNINIALAQVRSMLKKTQSVIMEMQGKAMQLQALAGQTKPVVDLARGIDDNQLWRELGDNAPSEKIKNLAQIHINSQEQSQEYLAIKALLYDADQNLAAKNANRNFLIEVENYLEHKNITDKEPSSLSTQFPSNAVLFAEIMLKTTDLIEVGTPASKLAPKGLLRNTLIAFMVSLCIASFCAYIYEWCKAEKI